MRKTVLRSLVVSAAISLGIGLTAVPAFAGPPYTVAGASGSASGRSTNTFLEVVDPATGDVKATLRCDVVTVGATINNGTFSRVVGTIGSSTWTNCQDDDFGFTFTVRQSGIWNINAINDGPDGPGGVTHGSVGNVQASISGPFCSGTFAGNQVPGFYSNAARTLTMAPGFDPSIPNDLRVTQDSCPLFNVGDIGRFNGVFTVTPNTITITG
jgi:hypothetical protein